MGSNSAGNGKGHLLGGLFHFRREICTTPVIQLNQHNWRLLGYCCRSGNGQHRARSCHSVFQKADIPFEESADTEAQPLCKSFFIRIDIIPTVVQNYACLNNGDLPTWTVALVAPRSNQRNSRQESILITAVPLKKRDGASSKSTQGSISAELFRF